MYLRKSWALYPRMLSYSDHTGALMRDAVATPSGSAVAAPAEFRACASLFATVVAVVTAVTEDAVRGMTANSLTTVSLQPMLLLLCLRRGSTMHELIARAGAFAISILAGDQEHIARHFADANRPAGPAQFEQVPWTAGSVTSAPIITGCLVGIECVLRSMLTAGDHAIVLAEVAALGRTQRTEPLVFYDRAYHSLESAPNPRMVLADQLADHCDRHLGSQLHHSASKKTVNPQADDSKPVHTNRCVIHHGSRACESA
jgi:flavin reductase